jgi:hypothetical protein
MHVAWVTDVSADLSQVTIEEMAWMFTCGDCSASFTGGCIDTKVDLGGGVGRCKRDADWFDGYIYPKITIVDISIYPTTASPGDELTFVYSIRWDSPGNRSIPNIRLGARIRTNNPEGSWIDDPANDKVITVLPGDNDYSRQFRIPSSATAGYYDSGWVILKHTSGTWLNEKIQERILRIEEQTLSVSLSANPPSGNAPLNGVDLTATVSGTATGTINYTFYCNRSDSGTNITYPNSFKIDDRNPDGTGGTVGTWGSATGYSGGTTFTVYNVCNYSTSGAYTAKVIAERGSAPPAEDRVNITVTGTAPPPPTGVSATDGTYTDKVRITWNASSGATSYEVYRATSSGGTKSKIGTPSGTSYDDYSASVGTTYYYWVKAKNAYGTSGYSSYNTGYRAGTAPPAPTNVQASDGTYTDKVRITWSASSGATSYEVYRATSSGGTKSKIGTPSGTSYDDTSASVGTTYYYWVKASNSYGTSGYSFCNTGYVKGPALPPTVTTSAVSSITSNSASSGGNVTSNGGASVTARGVCWSTSANPTTFDGHTSDGTGTGSFTSSITGLSPNTNYHVRAYATNSEGTGYGNEETFTTKGEGGKAMPWLELLLFGD